MVIKKTTIKIQIEIRILPCLYHNVSSKCKTKFRFIKEFHVCGFGVFYKYYCPDFIKF